MVLSYLWSNHRYENSAQSDDATITIYRLVPDYVVLYHFDQFDCHASRSISFIADLILSQFFRISGIFRNRKKVRLVSN